ncbi:MAG: hypothetical protein ICV63_14620 [Coleofasciculus sp. Co-bin14]|nr:hypothetical protein [Coleofasciculus sp. Co-bin14]
MKITEKIQNRLRLQVDKLKTARSTVLYGSACVVTGLAIIVLGGKRITLTCQRVEPTQGNCQLVSSSLLGSNEITIPLNQLQGAEVEVDEDSDGNTYRVVLLTNDSDVPFTLLWTSNARENEKNVNLINAFVVNAGKTSLRVQQDDRLSAYCWGGLFILIGGLTMLGFSGDFRWGGLKDDVF